MGNFAKTMQAYCTQACVPSIDAAFLLRNAKGELDPKKLAAVPQDKLAALVVAALKHCHESLAKE